MTSLPLAQIIRHILYIENNSYAHGQVIGVTSGAYTYGNNMYLAVPVDPVMAADLTVSGWTLKEVKAIEAAKDKD